MSGFVSDMTEKRVPSIATYKTQIFDWKGSIAMSFINVVGYGSLLSEASARETVPGLEDFRLVRVKNYKRLFNKVGIVFIQRNGYDPENRRVGSCVTRFDPNYEIICSLFRSPEDEFEALYEREHRFKWVQVECTEGNGSVVTGRMCSEYNDVDYRINKCVTESEYYRRVGQHYPGKIWRDDVLPFPIYLKFCLRAAASHGGEVLENFLTTTFLADGITPLKDYILTEPDLAQWQEDEPEYTYKR